MSALAGALGSVARPGGDARVWTTGVVLAIDEAAARLEVQVDDAVMVLPRADATYRVGDRVIVVRDPAVGGGQIVVGTTGTSPVPPRPHLGTLQAVWSTTCPVLLSDGVEVVARMVTTTLTTGDLVLVHWTPDGQPWVLGKVVTPPAPPSAPATPSLDRAESQVLVSWAAPAGSPTGYQVRWSTNGGASWSIRAGILTTSTTVTISQGQTLHVQVAAVNGGGSSAWSPSAVVAYPLTPTTEQVTAVVLPTWSGTYRHQRAAWDRWNTDRYGGASTLYQGSAYGSGPLTGLAVYGTQILDLGAASIDAVTVALPGAGLSSPPATIVVQGSPAGTPPAGPPTATGESVAAGQGSTSGVDRIALPPSMLEALRTGAVRGLAVVGSAYGAVRGTSHPEGLALTITYTKAV